MKKHMKNLLLGLMVIAMVFSVSGCGKDETTTEPKSTTSETETTSSDGSLERVKEAGKLTVAAEGNWVPFVYNDAETNELVGFEVEIAKEIAKRLGVEAEFNISSKWDGVIAGLDAKRYDVVICGVNPTPERLEKYNVSIPYSESQVVLVVAEDNDEIKGFEDIEGKLNGGALSSSCGDIARRYGAKITEASLVESMDLLKTGRIDCHINTQISIAQYLKEKSDTPVKIVGTYEPEERYEIESTALLRKEDEELTDAISDAIKEMNEDGTCYKLAEKYFGKDVADNISLYK